MDQQSLASPLEDTRNTTVDVVIDIAQFKTESARLQTFRSWPSRYAHIRPADLANAGFIYVGRDDLVRCVFCGQYVGNWEQEDFPMTEHRLLFPECPFILGRDVGNVPITHPDTAMQLPTQSGSSHDSYDETGIRPSAGRQINSGPEKGKVFLLFDSLSRYFWVSILTSKTIAESIFVIAQTIHFLEKARFSSF